MGTMCRKCNKQSSEFGDNQLVTYFRDHLFSFSWGLWINRPGNIWPRGLLLKWTNYAGSNCSKQIKWGPFVILPIVLPTYRKLIVCVTYFLFSNVLKFNERYLVRYFKINQPMVNSNPKFVSEYLNSNFQFKIWIKTNLFWREKFLSRNIKSPCSATSTIL